MLDFVEATSSDSDARWQAMTGKDRADFRVGRHLVVRGDCGEILGSIEPGSVDVVVTSPPYNLGIKYSQYDDSLAMQDYLAWLGRIAAGIGRCLKSEGSLFLNLSGSSANPWIAMDVANCFREQFVLQNNIVWVKSISIGETTKGHFKPIRSRRFLNHNHEAIFHFTKTGSVPVDRLAIGVPFQDKSNIARRGHAADRRCAGDTWFIPYETIQDRAQRFHHPAAFPEELVKRCLGLHGGNDLCVLDPFVGTGTTVVAAHELGHQGIGIDLDPTYVDAAVRRLSDRQE